ncbi:MAG: hypothetical protein SVV03_02460 [Candidatus Nanohaloarchaea archaeon]|nr:hypothetical protein [Candidatus Nanohaloarchaea archaeon]
MGSDSQQFDEERTWEEIKESCGIDDKETIKALAVKNYEFFLEHILGYNVDSPLIQEAIDVIQNPPEQPENNATKIAFMAPRGHSKTFTLTVGQTLWRCFKETSKEILIVAASQGQSTDILENIKRIIIRNDVLKHLEPDSDYVSENEEMLDIDSTETVWARESIHTTTDVRVKTKTFSPSIRSKHVDYVFCDDLLTDDSAGSKSTEQEKDLFYNVISPIAENSRGTLQIVGTPQKHDDLMMELMEKDNYYTRRFQAYDPETEEPLWPFKWDYDGLMAKKAEIGSSRFAREYMCNPMSVDERFFKEEMVQPNLDTNIGESHYLANPNKEEYSDWNWYLGVDIAMSDKKEADYTVFTVLGIDPDKRAWYSNKIRKQGMGPAEIAKKVMSLDRKYRFNYGYIEKNAIGTGTWKTIDKQIQTSGRIEAFDTTRKTRPTILSQLQAALDRGDLVLHDDEDLMEEMRNFHRSKSGKLEGKDKDDIVMSLAIAWHAYEDTEGVQGTLSLISEEAEEIDLNEDEEEFSDLEKETGIVEIA